MIYGIIAIWLVCGALAYSQVIGWHKAEIYAIPLGTGTLAFAWFFFIEGPVGLITVCFVNWANGGKFWYKPRFQLRTSPPTDPRFR